MSTDSNVTDIHEHRFERKVEKSVIEIAEGLLADAKAGKITALAYATIGFDGTSACAYSRTANMPALYGSIGLLFTRYGMHNIKE
ncbi:MAG: hypothetical protein IPO08_18530 [Xanthomonadales bacterium]|nr:hypothetical protein [Xanthomonadales bacterium]